MRDTPDPPDPAGAYMRRRPVVRAGITCSCFQICGAIIPGAIAELGGIAIIRAGSTVGLEPLLFIAGAFIVDPVTDLLKVAIPLSSATCICPFQIRRTQTAQTRADFLHVAFTLLAAANRTHGLQVITGAIVRDAIANLCDITNTNRAPTNRFTLQICRTIVRGARTILDRVAHALGSPARSIGSQESAILLATGPETTGAALAGFCDIENTVTAALFRAIRATTVAGCQIAIIALLGADQKVVAADLGQHDPARRVSDIVVVSSPTGGRPSVGKGTIGLPANGQRNKQPVRVLVLPIVGRTKTGNLSTESQPACMFVANRNERELFTWRNLQLTVAVSTPANRSSAFQQTATTAPTGSNLHKNPGGRCICPIIEG